MKPHLPLILSLTLAFSVAGLLAAEFPGKKTSWRDFDAFQFKHEGAGCRVVIPKKAAPGKPWIWRARFWGHEPQTDLALLAKGWSLAYCDVGNLFGSPKAVQRWNSFYTFLVEKHGYSPKPALEGMSRGGLIIYNWAKANPNRVCAIYADAPVCDFTSWPGGKGAGKRSDGAWKACLNAYGLTEQEALQHENQPFDNLAPLAQAGVPLLHVVGQADTVVPVAENTDVLEKRYKALGGSITVIRKDAVGHHPHSLKNPTPIVNFILKAADK